VGPAAVDDEAAPLKAIVNVVDIEGRVFLEVNRSTLFVPRVPGDRAVVGFCNGRLLDSGLGEIGTTIIFMR